MKSIKTFELSSRKTKNGRRKFKIVLYKLHPDSCIDEVNQVGKMSNKNGITWIREYCEQALPSIKGMSLRCEFIDEERTEICGHGETGIIDGEPVFEDAVVIGTFTKGYIEDVEDENGTTTYCIGEGEIDAQCYHNFVSKLDKDISNGIYPNGSVEIMHTEENNSIVYKYGYKDVGRIPTEFIHSGYALLGVSPADDDAKLIELNEKHKEESETMTENEIKTIVAQVISEMSAHEVELNKCKEECEQKIAEAATQVESLVAEKNDLIASSEQIQTALDEACEELSKKYEEINKLHEELSALREELGKALARERVGEMNTAIEQFSDEEKEYAKAEIDAFKENPVESEINSVVNKIWEGIGKKAKADAEAVAVVAEQNSAVKVDDIFGEVIIASTPEDTNIF